MSLSSCAASLHCYSCVGISIPIYFPNNFLDCVILVYDTIIIYYIKALFSLDFIVASLLCYLFIGSAETCFIRRRWRV